MDPSVIAELRRIARALERLPNPPKKEYARLTAETQPTQTLWYISGSQKDVELGHCKNIAIALNKAVEKGWSLEHFDGDRTLLSRELK